MISERFGWYDSYHVAVHKANESGANGGNLRPSFTKNGRFAGRPIIYTERVGGSSPSAPTTENRHFLQFIR